MHIPLWTITDLARAAQMKRASQPVSTNSRGLARCAGHWSGRKIAAVRAINLKAAQS